MNISVFCVAVWCAIGFIVLCKTFIHDAYIYHHNKYDCRIGDNAVGNDGWSLAVVLLLALVGSPIGLFLVFGYVLVTDKSFAVSVTPKNIQKLMDDEDSN